MKANERKCHDCGANIEQNQNHAAGCPSHVPGMAERPKPGHAATNEEMEYLRYVLDQCKTLANTGSPTPPWRVARVSIMMENPADPEAKPRTINFRADRIPEVRGVAALFAERLRYPIGKLYQMRRTERAAMLRAQLADLEADGTT